MATTASRLPVALQLFPRLRQYPAIQPRGRDSVPIGNREQVKIADIVKTIPHIYYDLGILAFEGCTDKQISRLGNLLSRIVSLGGIGGIHTAVGKSWKGKAERRRINSLSEDDLAIESLEDSHSGRVKRGAVHRIASASLRPFIYKHIAATTNLDPSTVKLQERKVRIRSQPTPRIFQHNPISDSPNPRIIPIDAFASILINSKKDAESGHLAGYMELYSGSGVGFTVSSCLIGYKVLHVDQKNQTTTGVSLPRKLPAIPEDNGDSPILQEQARKIFLSDVLPRMWDLEREVYGERADEILRMEKNEAGHDKKESDANHSAAEENDEKHPDLRPLSESMTPHS